MSVDLVPLVYLALASSTLVVLSLMAWLVDQICTDMELSERAYVRDYEFPR